LTETKQEILDEVAVLLGKPRHEVSTGSTELKQSLVDIVDSLHLDLDRDLSKPELAEAIVRASGGDWDESCDSRSTPSEGGSTVTAEGLRRVREAVRRLLARRP
jgi:hypothetical protein